MRCLKGAAEHRQAEKTGQDRGQGKRRRKRKTAYDSEADARLAEA
jgi:hypothetical protein